MKSRSTQSATVFVLMNRFIAILASVNPHEGWRAFGRYGTQREYNATDIDDQRTRLTLGRPSWSSRKNFGIHGSFREFVRNRPVWDQTEIEDRNSSSNFISENEISTSMDFVKANPSIILGNVTSLDLLIEFKTNASIILENATSLEQLSDSERNPSKFPENVTSLEKLNDSETNPSKFLENATSLEQLNDSGTNPNKFLENATSLEKLNDSQTSPSKFLETATSLEKLNDSGTNPTISNPPQISYEVLQKQTIQTNITPNTVSIGVNTSPTKKAQSKNILDQSETESQTAQIMSDQTGRDLNSYQVEFDRPLKELNQAQKLASKSPNTQSLLGVSVNISSTNIPPSGQSLFQSKNILDQSENDSQMIPIMSAQTGGDLYRLNVAFNGLFAGSNQPQKQTTESQNTQSLVSESLGINPTNVRLSDQPFLLMKNAENIRDKYKKESQTTQIMLDQTGRDLDRYQIELNQPFKDLNQPQRQTIQLHNTQNPVTVGVNISSTNIRPLAQSFLQPKYILNQTVKESQMAAIMSAQTGKDLDQLDVAFGRPFKRSNQLQKQIIPSHTTQNSVNIDMNIKPTNIRLLDQAFLSKKIQSKTVLNQSGKEAETTSTMSAKTGSSLDRLDEAIDRLFTRSNQPHEETIQSHNTQNPLSVDVNIDPTNIRPSDEPLIYPKEGRLRITPVQFKMKLKKTLITLDNKGADMRRLRRTSDRSVTSSISAQMSNGFTNQRAADVGVSLQRNMEAITPNGSTNQRTADIGVSLQRNMEAITPNGFTNQHTADVGVSLQRNMEAITPNGSTNQRTADVGVSLQRNMEAIAPNGFTNKRAADVGVSLQQNMEAITPNGFTNKRAADVGVSLQRNMGAITPNGFTNQRTTDVGVSLQRNMGAITPNGFTNQRTADVGVSIQRNMKAIAPDVSTNQRAADIGVSLERNMEAITPNGFTNKRAADVGVSLQRNMGAITPNGFTNQRTTDVGVSLQRNMGAITPNGFTNQRTTDVGVSIQRNMKAIAPDVSTNQRAADIGVSLERNMEAITPNGFTNKRTADVGVSLQRNMEVITPNSFTNKGAADVGVSLERNMGAITPNGSTNQRTTDVGVSIQENMGTITLSQSENGFENNPVMVTKIGADSSRLHVTIDRSIANVLPLQARSRASGNVTTKSHNKSTPVSSDRNTTPRNSRWSDSPSTSKEKQPKTSPLPPKTEPRQTRLSDGSITTLLSPQVRSNLIRKMTIHSKNLTPVSFYKETSSRKPRSSGLPSTSEEKQSKTSSHQPETESQQKILFDQSITTILAPQVRSNQTQKLTIHSDNLTPVSFDRDTSSRNPRSSDPPSTSKQKQSKNSPPESDTASQQTLLSVITTAISPQIRVNQARKITVLSHNSTPTSIDMYTSSIKPRSSGPPSTAKQNRSKTSSPQSITDTQQTLRMSTQVGSDLHGSLKRLLNGSSNQTREMIKDLNDILNRAQLDVNAAPTKLKDETETETVDPTQIKSINPPDSPTSNKTIRRSCHKCKSGRHNSITLKVRGSANRRGNQIIRIQIFNKQNPKMTVQRKQSRLPITPKPTLEERSKNSTLSNPASRNQQTITLKNEIFSKKSLPNREKDATTTTIQNGDVSLSVRVFPAIERSSSDFIRTNVQPTQSPNGITQISVDKSQMFRSPNDRFSQTDSFNKKSTETFLTEQMLLEDVLDSRKGKTFAEKMTDNSIPPVSKELCTQMPPQQGQISDQLNLRKSTSADRYVIPDKTNLDQSSNKVSWPNNDNERTPNAISNRLHGFNISRKKIYKDKKCRLEVNLNFNHGFRDIFGNNPGFGFENVGLRNGCAIFNGKSKIKLRSFENTTISQNFIIQLRFKPNPSAHRLNLNKEHLLSNCGWKVVPSIDIFITPYNECIYIAVQTTQSRLTLKGKYHATSWNEIKLSYNGKQLRKTMNGIVSSHSLSGDVIPKSASMMIGFCRLENGFHGCIDYVKIFLCKSDVKFQNEHRKNLLEK